MEVKRKSKNILEKAIFYNVIGFSSKLIFVFDNWKNAPPEREIFFPWKGHKGYKNNGEFYADLNDVTGLSDKVLPKKER